MNKVLVFDLDDTLMDNVHDYAEPILNMARVIIRELGLKAPHIPGVTALYQEIDTKRFHEINSATGREFLYSMERFPGTLVEVYKTICRKAGGEPKKSVEEELYQIGMQAFDPAKYRSKIHPGAISTINFILEQRDVPMLLSKGDEIVQSNKFSALDAGKLFVRSTIVDTKNPDTFRKMLEGGFETYTAYSVGNDYEKDIIPALEVGFKGVFIPVETWEVIGRMDKILAKVDRSRCLVLNNLSELKERYGEL